MPFCLHWSSFPNYPTSFPCLLSCLPAPSMSSLPCAAIRSTSISPAIFVHTCITTTGKSVSSSYFQWLIWGNKPAASISHSSHFPRDRSCPYPRSRVQMWVAIDFRVERITGLLQTVPDSLLNCWLSTSKHRFKHQPPRQQTWGALMAPGLLSTGWPVRKSMALRVR